MASAMRHGLGRLFKPDYRDARFPMRKLIVSTPTVQSRMWSAGPILDQGNTSECVAFAWKQWLDTAPIKDKNADPPVPLEIYTAAQAYDGDPLPHDGTTVRAGAEVFLKLGRLGAYHWAGSAEDVRLYLLTTGTVIFGVNWYDGMFDPTHDGFIHITGPIVGGHAFLVDGYSQTRGAFRCLNSWGIGWGQKGRFWIAGEDATRLLNEQGEACAGAEIRA